MHQCLLGPSVPSKLIEARYSSHQCPAPKHFWWGGNHGRRIFKIMAEKINVSICIVYYIYLYYGISNDSICIGNKISRDTLHFPAAFTMIFESIYHIGYYTITNAYTDKYIVILSVSGCEYNLNYVVAVVVHQFPC